MTVWRKQQGGYWDYNIDHLAKNDLAAFLKKIVSVKQQEL